MEFGPILEVLAYDAAFWTQSLIGTDYPIDQLGDASAQASERLRTLAIALLLSDANTDGFCHNLIRSGKARETFLRRCMNEHHLGDFHRISSRIDPFLDVIAANEFGLGRTIAELSPANWWQDNEYEDDYCYAQILHGMVRQDLDPAALAGLLEQFERSLEGADSPRLSVCRAFAARDGTVFAEAFTELIDAHDTHVMAARDRRADEDAAKAARRRVFVEGLAILRIAESLGLPTNAEYPYCPEAARIPPGRGFPSDDPIWPATRL